MATQLVWFIRDFRVHDHAPLAAAARCGPVVGLFVIEPSIISAPDYDAQHFAFAAASLTELRDRLRRRGGELLVRVGECPAVIEQVATEVGATAIWAHEEAGNLLTYARDLRVRA